VDPGQHVFTFEVAGQPPITRTFVLTEGEKGRRELVSGGGGAAPPVVPLAPGPGQVGQATTGGAMGTPKIVGLVLGGVGVAGLAVGSVFGMLAIAQKSQQQIDCPNPSCSPSGHTQAISDHSTGVTDGTISTVGFIAGGALLVGGAVLFFTAGPSPGQPARSGMIVAPSAGPGGGGVSLSGRF
jgi:hypothetical protein